MDWRRLALAGERGSRQAPAEDAERVDGEKLRAHVRDRRHSTSSFARAGEHSETAANPGSRVQPLADPEEGHRSRQAPAVTGALFAAHYALGADFWLDRSDSATGKEPACYFAMQSKRICYANSAVSALRRLLKNPTFTTGS